MPAGEILSPQRLAAAPAGSSGHRDMQGRACRTPTGSRLADHSLKGSSTQPAPNLAPGPSKPCLAGEPPFDTSGRQPIGHRTTSRAMWMEVRLTQARKSAATRSQPDIGAPNAIRQADYERLQAQHARCSTTRQVAVVHGKGPRRRRPTTRPRADGDRDIGPEINESVDYRCPSAAGGRRPVAPAASTRNRTAFSVASAPRASPPLNPADPSRRRGEDRGGTGRVDPELKEFSAQPLTQGDLFAPIALNG